MRRLPRNRIVTHVTMRSFSATCRASLAALLFVAITVSAAVPLFAQTATPKPLVWPATIAAGGGTIVLYEPQVRSWPNYTQITGVAALAVTLPGTSVPVYGTLSFTSLASADVPSGTVSLVNSKLDATSWPTASQTDAASLDAFVKANLHVAGSHCFRWPWFSRAFRAPHARTRFRFVRTRRSSM